MVFLQESRIFPKVLSGIPLQFVSGITPEVPSGFPGVLSEILSEIPTGILLGVVSQVLPGLPSEVYFEI